MKLWDVQGSLITVQSTAKLFNVQCSVQICGALLSLPMAFAAITSAGKLWEAQEMGSDRRLPSTWGHRGYRLPLPILIYQQVASGDGLPPQIFLHHPGALYRGWITPLDLFPWKFEKYTHQSSLSFHLQRGVNYLHRLPPPQRIIREMDYPYLFAYTSQRHWDGLPLFSPLSSSPSSSAKPVTVGCYLTIAQ